MNEWFQAEFHAERAHQFYESGQWDKALAELRLALAFDPEQSDWHFGMGLALEALQRHDEAATSFEEVLRLRGDDVETMMHLGLARINGGQPQRAVEILARASKIDPEYEPAICHRIGAHARLGEHDRAEELFYLARQIVDDCPQCYDHMAQSLMARGRLDKAEWCWQQALQIDAHFPGAWANLARVAWRRGQTQRASAMFIRHLRETPGDIPALLDLGRLLAEMGRHSEAGEKFRRVLEINPSDAGAHHHLGELSLLAGHLDAAAAELNQALRLDPDRAGLHLALAQVAQRRGLHDAARSHLAAELELPRHTPAQTLGVAQLLIELRLPQPAIDLLTPFLDAPAAPADAAPTPDPAADAATDLRPETVLAKSASAWLYRGVARMLLGKLDAGIADCRRAYRLAPRQFLISHNLALACLNQGRLAAAGVWLRRARAIKPDDAQVRALDTRLWRARLLASLTRAGRRIARAPGLRLVLGAPPARHPSRR